MRYLRSWLTRRGLAWFALQIAAFTGVVVFLYAVDPDPRNRITYYLVGLCAAALGTIGLSKLLDHLRYSGETITDIVVYSAASAVTVVIMIAIGLWFAPLANDYLGKPVADFIERALGGTSHPRPSSPS